MGVDELSRAIAEYVAIKRMLSTKEIREHIRLLLVARGLFPLRKGLVFKIHDVTSLCRLAEQVVALAKSLPVSFTLPSSTRLGC